MSKFRLLIYIFSITAWATLVAGQSWERDPLSGNWRVEAGGAGEGLLSLHRPATLVCRQQEAGGCLYEWQYDYSEPEMVVASRKGSLANYGTVVAQSVSEGQLTLLRGNSWAHTQVTLTAAGDGYYDGAWERGDQSSAESWLRLTPKVEYIGTSTIGLSAYAQLENWYGSGELVVVSTAGPYSQRMWRKENKRRGNRPVFRLFIVGENLWGFQDVSFPDALDFEVFTQGDMQPFEGGNPDAPPPGRWFRVVLWENATPGLKTLRINGEDFKFFVEIPGFPEPVTPVYVSVSFEGLGQDETEIPVDVSFAGLGGAPDIAPVAVSFQGLGGSLETLETEVSFEGMGRPQEAIETSVSFAGIARDLQPLQVGVSFVGLALPNIIPAVEVSFQGVENNTN